MLIYFDMDGVLADFEEGIRRQYAKPYADLEDVEVDHFWNIGCVREMTFQTLPPITEGVHLLRWVISRTPHDVAILSSTGGGKHHNEIARQKLQWLDTHILDTLPAAFCTGTQSKALFAMDGALLIDDRKKVIDAWRERDAFALLFEQGESQRIVDAISGMPA